MNHRTLRRLSIGFTLVTVLSITAPPLPAGHINTCPIIVEILRKQRQIAADQSELALRQNERVRIDQDLAVVLGRIDTWSRQVNNDTHIWKQAVQTERTSRLANVATTRRVRQHFETSPELTQLLKSLEAARSEIEKARKQGLEPLKRSEEYKQVLATMEAARSKIVQLRKAEKPDAAAIASVSQSLLKQDAEVEAMETDRLKSNAPYVNAKERYEQLKRRMIAIRTEHAEALKYDKRILQARQSFKKSQLDLRNAKGQKLQSEKQLQLAQASATGLLRRANDIDARIAYLVRSIAFREGRIRQLERLGVTGCTCHTP